MNEKSHKVHFEHGSKNDYVWPILKSILNLSLFKDLCKLAAYYCVNHTIGRRQIKVGNGSKIHDTVILRQASNIEIGDGCLINHNNVFLGQSPKAIEIKQNKPMGNQTSFCIAN